MANTTFYGLRLFEAVITPGTQYCPQWIVLIEFDFRNPGYVEKYRRYGRRVPAAERAAIGTPGCMGEGRLKQKEEFV